MVIKVNSEEYKELIEILKLLRSKYKVNQNLAFSLLKNYKQFYNYSYIFHTFTLQPIKCSKQLYDFADDDYVMIKYSELMDTPYFSINATILFIKGILCEEDIFYMQ